jgi:hypothetical protein
MAKLSVVGIGMRSHSGVAARMFECLGRGGINIQLVSTSEIKIAVIIDEKDAERAAQLIHGEFGLARLMPAAGVPQALSAFKTHEIDPRVARPRRPKEVSGPKQRGRRKGTPKV